MQSQLFNVRPKGHLMMPPAPLVRGSCLTGWTTGLFACLWPFFAFSQSSTDAASVQRDIERTRQTTPAPQTQSGSIEQPPTPRPGATTVVLKGWRLQGHTIVPEADLQRALTPWLGVPLDLEGVQSATQRISAVYESLGRLASATIGRQDITEGVVTVHILEARFAGTRISGPASERVPAQQLLDIADAYLKKGDLLDLRAMNRALLLMDDLPGVAVSGTLAAGTGSAETELLLELADEPRVSTMIQIDNAGGRSVGQERLVAQVGVVSPLGFGDQAQLTALGTRGSKYARAAYGWPLNPAGLRAQTWLTGVEYRVISRELRDLSAHGQSTSAGAALTWPFMRAREFNINGKVATEARRMENFANGSVSSDYGARNFQLELSGNAFDTFGGGGANAASITLTSGRIHLAGSPNESSDAQAARTAGAFRKWSLQLSRQQVITSDLTLFAAITAQHSGRNLDSGERFSLGGMSGVRAYPGNEGSGSAGQLLNIELRQRANDRLTLTAFYDVGSVRVYAQPLSSSGQNLAGDGPNRYILSGVGGSVNWLSPAGIQLQLTLARPLGNHPSPGSVSTNQDGSHLGSRAWLSASMNF